MNYTLHQLTIFLAVVKIGSITKAAAEMHMTQPALSIQLKNFQDQFKIPLTEYSGKKIRITEFGKEISELAENIINEAHKIKYKTKEYSNLFAGKLKISSVSTGKYVIPYFLDQFIKDNNGIDLVLDVSNKTEVLEDLKINKIDFALVSIIPENIDVNQEVLLDNKLFLVGNDNDFKRNSSLIYREQGSATRKAMDKYFDRKGERKSLTLTSNEAVKQAVIAGLGYSVIPLIGLKNEINQKQVTIIKKPNLPIITKWRLIWLKNKKLSPVAEAYLNFLSSNKEDIINEKFDWYLNFE
jgi:DNA-binding transcriptional LysR family regulator